MNFWVLIATNCGVQDVFLVKTKCENLTLDRAVELLRVADPDLHCWTVEESLTWELVAVEPELALQID